MCCKFYPFILLDDIIEMTGNFCVDVAHIGWTTLYWCLSFIVFYTCILLIIIAMRSYFSNKKISDENDKDEEVLYAEQGTDSDTSN